MAYWPLCWNLSVDIKEASTQIGADGLFPYARETQGKKARLGASQNELVIVDSPQGYSSSCSSSAQQNERAAGCSKTMSPLVF